MTSFRNVRSSGDGGNARAARQLSDEAFFHRVIDFTGKAYEAEGITFVASPSTSDFFGLDADPRDPALERERRALEERVCRDIAEALAQPENHRHRETLALDGCLTVTLGERARLLAVEPSLEIGAELRAARFRSARGLRPSRPRADSDAEVLHALGQRLALHGAGSLPINPPWPDVEFSECPPAHDIALVRRLIHEAPLFGTLRLELTIGAWVSPGGAPDYDTIQGEGFRDDVARYSAMIERVIRAVLRLRRVRPADFGPTGLSVRLFESDPAEIAVTLPSFERAVCSQAALLRSPAGLRLDRMRANDIASLFDQLAMLSRLPVRRS
jgi:hypothetical protein